MKEELSGTGFVIFGDRVNILQIFQVDIIGSPTNDTRLVLNWTPSSTKYSTSHWLAQSAPELPLVTFETLCWNWKHVMFNLGSLTGCYSCFFSCQRRVAISFGCAYLKGVHGLEPPPWKTHWIHVIGHCPRPPWAPHLMAPCLSGTLRMAT
jgi:hypothetical protein